MKILENGEDFDKLYGWQNYILTKKEIQALLDGKTLYTDINDEYAITIELEGNKKKETVNDLSIWKEWFEKEL